MKLTGVELDPGGMADSVALSFRDPRRLQPYNVKKITGLDASEIIARFYQAPGNLLDKFYSLSLEKRDLGFIIELNPDFATNSYSDLRDDMYRMISSSRTGLVDVLLKNGETTVASISGHISGLETDLFDKNQEVTLNLSCTSGETLLRAPVDVDVDLEEVTPENTIINDLLSTAPHGFAFNIAFTGPQASFRIENDNDSSIFFEVTPVGGFLADDILAFSSEPNDKYAFIIRGVTDIQLADVITRSAWPIIFPGSNVFVCSNPENLAWVSISHRPTYWGV